MDRDERVERIVIWSLASIIMACGTFLGGTFYGICWYEDEILPTWIDQVKARCDRVESCESPSVSD